jgi:hypothetical protein
MKIRSWSILPVALIFPATLFLSWKDLQKSSEIPDHVLTILNSKCVGCHSTDSRNEDAKKKVDFKKWDELSVVKKVGTLADIKDVLEKGKMPPDKFLNRFPEKAVSPVEKDTLIEWTRIATSKLME